MNPDLRIDPKRYPFFEWALAIARLRGEVQLTQGEFAARVGTTQSAIARAESGRHGVSARLLYRIAAAFGRHVAIEFVDPKAVVPLEPHVNAFIEELHQRHRAYEELLVQRAERAEQAATEARREHAMWVEATYGGDGRTAHVVDAEWYERAAAALEGVAEARRELLAATSAPDTGAEERLRAALDDANNVVNTEWANGNVAHGAEARILNALNMVRVRISLLSGGSVDEEAPNG